MKESWHSLKRDLVWPRYLNVKYGRCKIIPRSDNQCTLCNSREIVNEFHFCSCLLCFSFLNDKKNKTQNLTTK